MSYNKVYENKPIWHNDREPSINEARLNALSNAVDIIDNRVIELDEKPLEDISNMQITDLQDGQGIKWNEELQKWENGVVGGIVDITNAEYEYLVEHDLDDRTVTYNITDLNPDGTLIDDSLTESDTKTWSINNLSGKFSAINSDLSPLRNYNDDEIEIGTYGTHKVYRRILKGTLSGQNTAVPFAYGDNILKFDIFLKKDSYRWLTPYYNSTTDNFRAYVERANIRIVSGSGYPGQTSETSYEIHVEYYK